MSRSLNKFNTNKRSLQAYCKAIPFSYTKPAFDAALEVAASGGLFLVDFSSTDVMSLNLRSINPLSVYRCEDSSKNLYCDTNESFWFAVDKNGVVRMSGFPPDSFIFTQLGGTVLPYLFGVETTGFKNGDRMYVYYSDVNNDGLWFANSGEGDGGYTFDTTQTSIIQIDGGELIRANDSTGSNCIPKLNTTIWGWLDEVAEDLGRVDSLEKEINSYKEAETIWRNEKSTLESDLSSRPTQEQVVELQNQLDSRPTVTPNDSQYGDFFKKLTDDLTTGISSLQSSLGSNEADDEVDEGQSNFSGNDPFNYKKNKY